MEYSKIDGELYLTKFDNEESNNMDISEIQ